VLSLNRILSFLKLKTRKTIHLENSLPVKSEFGCEAEKQDLIWRAFGVDYKREIMQLEEARERFLLQLKSNMMTDDMRDFIEQVVRDEVRRILKPKG
jgi:hypothetical protein